MLTAGLSRFPYLCLITVIRGILNHSIFGTSLRHAQKNTASISFILDSYFEDIFFGHNEGSATLREIGRKSNYARWSIACGTMGAVGSSMGAGLDDGPGGWFGETAVSP